MRKRRKGKRTDPKYAGAKVLRPLHELGRALDREAAKLTGGSTKLARRKHKSKRKAQKRGIAKHFGWPT